MNTNYFHRIDDYLMGQLNSADQQNFIQQMEMDRELAEEVKIRKTMLDNVMDLGDLHMHEMLKEIKSEVIPADSDEVSLPAKSKRKYIWLIAAAAAAVLLLLLAYPVLNAPASAQELYAQYYKAYPLPFGDRGEGLDPSFVVAGNLYQDGTYDQALPLLQAISTNPNETDDRIQLALGICQLEAQQFSKALLTFDQIKNESSNLYLDQANWYSALTHLQLNDLSTAKTLLQTIATKPKHHFYQPARQLLKKIK